MEDRDTDKLIINTQRLDPFELCKKLNIDLENACSLHHNFSHYELSIFLNLKERY